MAYDKARVGRRIKSLRIDKGIDQKQLAEISGVSLASISQYELGQTVIGMENAVKIADVLGCSLDSLACRD